ncbi:hypothetical protein HanIR_Chr05g0219671 [Helianthus annuus]|nr:hypothetical protein HanIR_Chr05g0219671 [Helianthus annuus]
MPSTFTFNSLCPSFHPKNLGMVGPSKYPLFCLNSGNSSRIHICKCIIYQLLVYKLI